MAIKLSALAMLVRLPLPTPLIAMAGVVGSLLGVTSLVKNQDRALMTWVSAFIGLLIILWIAAELTFPH